MNLALAVGIIGSLAGLVAGLAGTYLAVGSTAGPRERSFMVRAALVCWLGVGLVVTARFVLPSFVWPVVSLGGLLGLSPGLRWWSDRQGEVRLAERAAPRRTGLVDQESGRL